MNHITAHRKFPEPGPGFPLPPGAVNMLVVDAAFHARAGVPDYPARVMSLVAEFIKNGQAGDLWPAFIVRRNVVRARLTVPEPESLEPRHDGPLVKEARRALAAASRRGPSLSFRGRALGTADVCRCKAPSSRVLHASQIDEDPPLRCGDCRGGVALYRAGLDPEALVFWARTFKALDALWTGSAELEGRAGVQLARIGSPFMRRTRKLAQDGERKTRIPHFAPLLRISDRPRLSCPACRRAPASNPKLPWMRRCMPCRLVFL